MDKAAQALTTAGKRGSANTGGRIYNKYLNMWYQGGVAGTPNTSARV